MPLTMNFTMRLLTTFTLGAVVCALGCGVEPRRDVQIDEPLAPVEEPVENAEEGAPDDATTASGPTSITFLAIDGERTMAYAFTLEIDDITAVPLDEPVEAGPGLAVRIIEIGAGEIPVINEAACARLGDPSPACDREVTLYETSPPREHVGVMTLWTNEHVLTGIVDAELSYDESARGTFSVDL